MKHKCIPTIVPSSSEQAATYRITARRKASLSLCKSFEYMAVTHIPTVYYWPETSVYCLSIPLVNTEILNIK